MNILLTEFCNSNCPFCFAKKHMASIQNDEMSLDNVRKVIKFLISSDEKWFNMLGGEPTLHSKFLDIFNIIHDSGLIIQIFSNGIIKKEIVDRIKATVNTCLVINLRELSEYNKSDWKKIEYTLSQLRGRITLTYRIYKADFDFSFMYDLINKFNLQRHIILGITVPTLDRTTQFISLKEYQVITKRLAEFSELVKDKKVTWESDHGWRLCAFNNYDYRRLCINTGFVPLTVCNVVIDVDSELSAFACFGAESIAKVNLFDFKDTRELRAYFIKTIKPIRKSILLDECKKCNHFEQQRCDGGCIVFGLNKQLEEKYG